MNYNKSALAEARRFPRAPLWGNWSSSASGGPGPLCMPAGMLPQLPPVPCRTERRHGAKQSEEESLMVTFFVCLVLLIVGFFTYSKLVEKIFRIEDSESMSL